MGVGVEDLGSLSSVHWNRTLTLKSLVAIAGLLAERQRSPAGTTRWLIRQGFDMGRPSLIELEADVAGDALAAVRVGGAAVIIGRGSLDLQ